MTGPASADERRGYGRGYNAGKRRRERESAEDALRADAAIYLFECLVAGLVAQGLTIDAILDVQLIGAKERAV